jgi:hypothetical protein
VIIGKVWIADAEIVFRVLVEILGHDSIAFNRCLSRKVHLALEKLCGLPRTFASAQSLTKGRLVAAGGAQVPAPKRSQGR